MSWRLAPPRRQALCCALPVSQRSAAARQPPTVPSCMVLYVQAFNLTYHRPLILLSLGGPPLCVRARTGAPASTGLRAAAIATAGSKGPGRGRCVRVCSDTAAVPGTACVCMCRPQELAGGGGRGVGSSGCRGSTGARRLRRCSLSGTGREGSRRLGRRRGLEHSVEGRLARGNVGGGPAALPHSKHRVGRQHRRTMPTP